MKRKEKQKKKHNANISLATLSSDISSRQNGQRKAENRKTGMIIYAVSDPMLEETGGRVIKSWINR